MPRLSAFLLLMAIPLAMASQQPPTANTAPTQIQGEMAKVSGWPLYYSDIVVGTGPVAESGKHVTVHYTGWLETGKRFESSLDKKRPYKFQLGAGKVIRGWDLGIEGMRVGGKRQLRIPDSMAYGIAGSPPKIPPGATLIFEIELLSVEK